MEGELWGSRRKKLAAVLGGLMVIGVGKVLWTGEVVFESELISKEEVEKKIVYDPHNPFVPAGMVKVVLSEEESDAYGVLIEKQERKEPMGEVAYCAYGLAKKVFDFPKTLDMLKMNVLNPMNADLFTVVPETKSAESKLIIGESSSAWVYTDDDMVVGDLTKWMKAVNPSLYAALARTEEHGNVLGCLRNRRGGWLFHRGHGQCQLLDLYNCHKLISRREAMFNRTYKFVAFGRIDARFANPHVPIEMIDSIKEVGCWIPCSSQDWGGFCDQYAICRRNGVADFAYAAYYVDSVKKERSPSFLKLHHYVLNTEKYLKKRMTVNKVEVGRLPLLTFFRLWRPRKCKVKNRNEVFNRRNICMNVSGTMIRSIEWTHFADFSDSHGGRLAATPEEWHQMTIKWFQEEMKRFSRFNLKSAKAVLAKYSKSLNF